MPAMNTLWRLAAERPQLLAAHAAGYLALVQADGPRSMQLLVRRLLWLALSLAALVAAVVLAGVALMLAPDLRAPPWLLVVVPAVPALASAAALWAARRPGPLPVWAALRQQWAADRALLRHWGP